MSSFLLTVAYLYSLYCRFFDMLGIIVLLTFTNLGYRILVKLVHIDPFMGLCDWYRFCWDHANNRATTPIVVPKNVI